MEKGLKQLIDIIEQQSVCYDGLLDLFEKERDAIVKSDIDRLNALIQEKEQQLEIIRKTEQQRISVVNGLAAALGRKPKDLTLRRLAKLVPEPFASKLGDLGRQCNQRFEKVQSESATNRSLCLHALAFVNGSLKLLGQLAADGPVYRSTGQVRLNETAGRVLSSAV